MRVWGEGEAPSGFIWQGVYHHILNTYNRWRVHTRWWEPGEATRREYVKVTTDKGLLCLLYQDMHTGGWFLARIYD